jgi:DNA-binding transcriptional regulator PaaX
MDIHRTRKFGPRSATGRVQSKIMLLLFAGVALGLSRSHSKNKRVIKGLIGEWNKLGPDYNGNARRSLHALFTDKLVEEIKQPDGSFILKLTKEGVRRAHVRTAIRGSIECKIPPQWDGKWRVVVFDIPESNRAFRDILRNHLHTLHFYKLQQSVFISPHPYEEALLELIHVYKANAYVRIMTVTTISGEDELKRYFFDKKNLPDTAQKTGTPK